MSNNKIFIAGHKGMVGSAIYKELSKNHDNELITACRDELDLTNQQAVLDFLKLNSPDIIYIAAAKVGGVHANNTFPADFIYQNISIASNLISGAFQSRIKKILYLGSSCIYPVNAQQPMKEQSLLNGHFEPTNEPYAVAKVAGIKMCESYNRQFNNIDYRSIIPASLYGPGDNYHSENSHVIPAMIKRFHEAKLNGLNHVSIWGSGKPRREFLHVTDLANAAVSLMNISKEDYIKLTEPMISHFNIGSGSDISIKELAEIIAKTVGFEGEISCDTSKPDGVYQKLLDSSKINSIGWKPSIGLYEGLSLAYSDYLNNLKTLRMR
jgi:GDP-L-fucose synthase